MSAPSQRRRRAVPVRIPSTTRRRHRIVVRRRWEATTGVRRVGSRCALAAPRRSAKIFQAIPEICEIFSDELARWRRGRLFLRSDILGLVFFSLAGLFVPIPSYVHFLSWIEKYLARGHPPPAPPERRRGKKNNTNDGGRRRGRK